MVNFIKLGKNDIKLYIFYIGILLLIFYVFYIIYIDSKFFYIEYNIDYNIYNKDMDKIRYSDLSLESIKDKNRRIFNWIVWERYTDKYHSYDEFKSSWDSNIKLHEIIKNDIKDYIENSDRIHKLKLIRWTFLWFKNRGNIRRTKEFRRPKNFTPDFSRYRNSNR